jgi:hypothetical protein
MHILDKKCGKHLKFSDLIQCGKTWKRFQNDIPNLPEQPDTLKSMIQLCDDILDPIIGHFGDIELTYGFCSKQLAARIKQNEHPNIYPSLDQHAGHEINTRGNFICKRLGQAVDFIIPQKSTIDVSKWIMQNLKFDRLYFYGSRLPLHISVGPQISGSCVGMKTNVNGRRIPKQLNNLEAALTHFETFDT